MATVVHLSDYPRKTRREQPPASGATIHLFLGVRYERHSEPPKAPARGGKGRKRA